MLLITETIEDVKFLSEENNGKKSYYVEGVVLQSNKQNKNGRIYPKDVLAREVARYTKDYINTNRAMGELGHPDSPLINLDRVSHKFEWLKEDGNNWYGRAKVLDTPYGKIAKNFIDEGIKLGISSRGLGSLTARNGINFVQDDYKLATAGDLVADPSAPDAFVQGILESKEWILKNGEWTEVDLEAAKKTLREAHRSEVEDKALSLFEQYIKGI